MLDAGVEDTQPSWTPTVHAKGKKCETLFYDRDITNKNNRNGSTLTPFAKFYKLLSSLVQPDSQTAGYW